MSQKRTGLTATGPKGRIYEQPFTAEERDYVGREKRRVRLWCKLR